MKQTLNSLQEAQVEAVENIVSFTKQDFIPDPIPPPFQLQSLGFDGANEFSFTLNQSSCEIHNDGTCSFEINFQPSQILSHLTDKYANSIGFIVWGSSQYKAPLMVPDTDFLLILAYCKVFKDFITDAPGANCRLRLYKTENPDYFKTTTRYKAGNFARFTLGLVSQFANVREVDTIELQIR